MDQFFIYFRETPKGIKLLVSRDLSPMTTSKRLMRRDDPLFDRAQTLCWALIGLLKQHGYGGRGGLIPRAANFSAICQKAGDMALLQTSWLPQNGIYGNRILAKVAK